jgi:phospholipid/cholesterol/gamma-HCH transport system permease protein
VCCNGVFHCYPGADGVGRAATSAFVHSFVSILALDIVLGILVDKVYLWLYPNGMRLF